MMFLEENFISNITLREIQLVYTYPIITDSSSPQNHSKKTTKNDWKLLKPVLIFSMCSGLSKE